MLGELTPSPVVEEARAELGRAAALSPNARDRQLLLERAARCFR